MKLGGISYSIYLWHWPLLVFYLNLTDDKKVNIWDGILIITISIILSFITTLFIEKPIRKMNHRIQLKKTLIIILFLMIPALTSTMLWQNNFRNAQAQLDEKFNFIDYPGALALMENKDVDDELPFLPEPLQARNDVPESYDDKCHQTGDNSEVIQCEYGELEDYEYEIALVGGSHSAHWLPALQVIAESEPIKIYNLTMSGCRFTLLNEQDLNEACIKWSKNTLAHLKKLKPDIVFTTANVSSGGSIPKGYEQIWNELDSAGIEVFAIRDNPWLKVDGPSCVEENHNKLIKCSIARNVALSPELDLEKEQQNFRNVEFLDISDAFCEEDFCNAVVGNVLVYRDSHHITSTYAQTLGPVIRPYLMKTLSQ